MTNLFASLAAAFASELLIGIFLLGKLFQRVTDIDRRVTRIEDSTCCREDE